MVTNPIEAMYNEFLRLAHQGKPPTWAKAKRHCKYCHGRGTISKVLGVDDKGREQRQSEACPCVVSQIAAAYQRELHALNAPDPVKAAPKTRLPRAKDLGRLQRLEETLRRRTDKLHKTTASLAALDNEGPAVDLRERQSRQQRSLELSEHHLEDLEHFVGELDAFKDYLNETKATLQEARLEVAEAIKERQTELRKTEAELEQHHQETAKKRGKLTNLATVHRKELERTKDRLETARRRLGLEAS